MAAGETQPETGAREFEVGTRWRAAVSGAEVVVVRPAAGPVSVTCAGEVLTPFDGTSPTLAQGAAPFVDGAAILLGKRYYDELTGLELLCTKGGRGPFAVDGRALGIRVTKPLPSSD